MAIWPVLKSVYCFSPNHSHGNNLCFHRNVFTTNEYEAKSLSLFTKLKIQVPTMSCETDRFGDTKPLNGGVRYAHISRSATVSRIPVTPTQSILMGRGRQPSRSSLERNISYGNMLAPSTRTEAKVLVIYTGGTIGMMRNEKNGE